MATISGTTLHLQQLVRQSDDDDPSQSTMVERVRYKIRQVEHDSTVFEQRMAKIHTIRATQWAKGDHHEYNLKAENLATGVYR